MMMRRIFCTANEISFRDDSDEEPDIIFFPGNNIPYSHSEDWDEDLRVQEEVKEISPVDKMSTPQEAQNEDLRVQEEVKEISPIDKIPPQEAQDDVLPAQKASDKDLRVQTDWDEGIREQKEPKEISILFVDSSKMVLSDMVYVLFSRISERWPFSFTLKAAVIPSWVSVGPRDEVLVLSYEDKGVEIPPFREYMVTDDDFKKYDYILAMDRETLDSLLKRQQDRADVRLFDLKDGKDVCGFADDWGSHSPEGVYATITSLSYRFLESLARWHGVPEPEDEWRTPDEAEKLYGYGLP